MKEEKKKTQRARKRERQRVKKQLSRRGVGKNTMVQEIKKYRVKCRRGKELTQLPPSYSPCLIKTHNYSTAETWSLPSTLKKQLLTAKRVVRLKVADFSRGS